MSEQTEHAPEQPAEQPAERHEPRPEPQAPQPPAAQPQKSAGPRAAALQGALVRASLCRLVPGLDWDGAGKLSEQLAALAEAASDEELAAVLGACKCG